MCERERNKDLKTPTERAHKKGETEDALVQLNKTVVRLPQLNRTVQN